MRERSMLQCSYLRARSTPPGRAAVFRKTGENDTGLGADAGIPGRSLAHSEPGATIAYLKAMAVAAVPIVAFLTLVWPSTAHAYIGPGAGFAVVGSLGVVLVTFLLALLSLATYPFRAAVRFVRARKLRKPTGVKGVVILGLDGLDPELARRFMDQGKLPNLKRLAEDGCFHKLRTTCPAMSPVAWSTFATGVDPSRHNIFDFLNRDLSSYIPILSSTEIIAPSRLLKLGRYVIPLSKPSVRLLRKSRPFWNVLGDCYVSCHVIRVPLTFPPEKCKNGVLLSAMCVPDLRGTQGSFTYFTTRPEEETPTGGRVERVRMDNGVVKGEIPGPPDPMRPDAGELTVPFTVTPAKSRGGDSRGAPTSKRGSTDVDAVLEIGGQKMALSTRAYTPWVRISFKAGLGVRVRGICRFCLLETGDHFGLYMTPINIDPEKPAMPISQPGVFATYLAKLNGSFATLGLAEDTWALNEKVLDEETFLKQAYLYHEEREKMFLNSLAKNKRGLTVCVFDATDRIQHMFLRHFDDEEAVEDERARIHKRAIEEIYTRADALVGKTMKGIGPDSVLMVISDHGFKVFKRGVNLNSWLFDNGYMAAQDGRIGEYFKGVDWSKTKAYAFGLSGIYINKKGRERKGVVDKSEYNALKKELKEKLEGLVDEETGQVAIVRVYDTAELYNGPYVDNGPDLIIGYNVGYRASWDGAVGKGNGRTFEDNEKNWGGDHCMDPELVPGVFFSNRKINTPDPSLMDISTSTLRLFGVSVPHYMKGRALFPLDDG
jgi:predicted AlkP superfamily phosphohydrolase/phosphomutase